MRIVDRKKELIINAAGKNMSPANIENAIKAACPMIGAIVTIGDARPYNTALLVFDADSIGPHAADLGLADASPAALASHPGMLAKIRQGSPRATRFVPGRADQTLPRTAHPVGAGGDEITLTMKLKRRPIAAKYAAEIEELYVSGPGPDIREPARASTTQPA